MKFVRFVTELARRRVFRLVGFYVVGAWLILQVASVTFDPIGLPDGSMRFLIYIIVVGFFPALVFSWRYDITTHGIVRATETGDATDAPLRRSDWLLISGSTNRSRFAAENAVAAGEPKLKPGK